MSAAAPAAPANGGALIWCPFPDSASARAAIERLLDESLIACANILPQIYSVFQWQGERGEAEETGVLLKTSTCLLDRAVGRLAELHPYETPAILGWRCDSAAPATLAWMGTLPC